MKLIQLGRANDALCHFLSFGGYELLLDCGVSLSAAAIPASATHEADAGRIAPLQIELPALDTIDVSSVDVLLISNHHSILALPFLTEYLGFKGVVYATDMTKRIGRVLLEELAAHTESDATDVVVRFVKPRPTAASSADSVDDSDMTPVLHTFTLGDVARSCGAIRSVEYKELVKLSYGVQLTALSSGFSLGACVWLLESPTDRFAYVPAASGDLNRHPKELDFAPLIECDTLLLTDIKPARDPHATTERTVETVLAAVGRVLDRGGVCVIPCALSGVVFDLIEAIFAARVANKPHPLPLYFLSPFGEQVLDLTQCGAEWLCEKKIEKLYAGEAAFLHDALRSNKQLHVASEMSNAVITGLQHGGVVFASHQSLQLGLAPELVRLYGHDSRNAVLLVDPSVDPHTALAPFFALDIEKMVCPIDARLSCGDVNQFIARCCPRNLIVPHEYLVDAVPPDDIKTDEPQQQQQQASHFARVFSLHDLTVAKPKTELATFAMKLLEPIVLDKPNKYIDGKLDPELAMRALMTDVGGKGAASVRGVITVRHDDFVVAAASTGADPSRVAVADVSEEEQRLPHPDKHNGDTMEARATGTKRKAPSSSPWPSLLSSSPSSVASSITGHAIDFREQSSLLIGQVDEEKLLKQIKTHDPRLDVYISQGPDNADAMLSIPALDARITIWKDAARTRLETPSEDTRSLLLPMVLAQLHVLRGT